MVSGVAQVSGDTPDEVMSAMKMHYSTGTPPSFPMPRNLFFSNLDEVRRPSTPSNYSHYAHTSPRPAEVKERFSTKLPLGFISARRGCGLVLHSPDLLLHPQNLSRITGTTSLNHTLNLTVT